MITLKERDKTCVVLIPLNLCQVCVRSKMPDLSYVYMFWSTTVCVGSIPTADKSVMTYFLFKSLNHHGIVEALR